jgi:hypothetical protein
MTLPLAAAGRRISAAAPPALARYFLPRGRLGFLIDGDREAMLSHYVEGKEPRYFKGPSRPVLGDLAYTEKVIFE